MPKLDFRFIGRRHSKKHRQKYRSGKLYSAAAERIHNIYGESIGRPNEQRVLEIANSQTRDILREDVERGRIEEVDFEARISEPWSEEDMRKKDLIITFSLPERLRGESIFAQIRSSEEGAREFRRKYGDTIPVITVNKIKNPKRNKSRIARSIAEIIRQEINKTRNQVEAST